MVSESTATPEVAGTIGSDRLPQHIVGKGCR